MMTLHDAIREARAGKSLVVRCPAHDDHSPSVSVGPGRGGGVLIKCHTGCPTESVLAAAGLKWADICAPRQTLAVVPLLRPIAVQRAVQPSDDEERQAKRAEWPKFDLPTDADLDQIATVRGIGREGLELAVARGILWVVSKYRGHRSWIVTDSARHSAQARRLDGLKFETATSSTKALTLPGSIAAWPIGVEAITDNHQAILLTEGGPDLLAAHHFIVCEGRQRDAAAAGILGASCNICERVLARFSGRRVRIAQHADDKGEQAAKRWARQLLPYVKHVDGIYLGGLRQHDDRPVEDLNDLARIHPDDFEVHRWIWSITP